MRQKKSRSTRKPGFSEEATSFGAQSAGAPMQQSVELGAGGRLVIPAPMRAALGIKVGDRLTVRLEGNELRILTFKEGLRRARETLAKYLPPGVDAVDDFLRWKREQAALEEAKYDRWTRGE